MIGQLSPVHSAKSHACNKTLKLVFLLFLDFKRMLSRLSAGALKKAVALNVTVRGAPRSSILLNSSRVSLFFQLYAYHVTEIVFRFDLLLLAHLPLPLRYLVSLYTRNVS
jgi:hypothetical protein